MLQALTKGVYLLQGLTTVLFPLTVIKTRQQAIEGAPSGISGAAQVARDVVKTDGFRGLYRGFGTVIIGVIPARGVRSPSREQRSRVQTEVEALPLFTDFPWKRGQRSSLVCLLISGISYNAGDGKGIVCGFCSSAGTHTLDGSRDDEFRWRGCGIPCDADCSRAH